MIDLAEQIREEVSDRFVAMDADRAAAEIGEIGLGRMIEGDQARHALAQRRVRRVVQRAQPLPRRPVRPGPGDAAEWGAPGREGRRDLVQVVCYSETTKTRSSSGARGRPTYFATDIAYHYNKFLERGFDRVIDVLGADHQGHVSFMKAFASAASIDPDRLDLLVYQLVTLKRGGATVRLSKRTGNIVTLKELVEEIGPDACRFFFLSKAPGSQMELDLELAVRESEENPVFYIQYAHARIAGIFREARERGIDFEGGDVSLLTHDAELALVRKMVQLPEVVAMAAENLEPQGLPHYALDLAKAFHPFYQQCRVVSQDPDDLGTTMARLKLVDAVRVVFARCLSLMGMAAPERM